MALRPRLAAGLGEMPPIPAELASPAFLAGIHERVIEAVESDPLSEMVGVAMPVVPQGDYCQSLPDRPMSGLRAALQVDAVPNVFVWERVGRSVVGQALLVERRRRWSRLGVLAAGSVAAGVFALATGWMAGHEDGPEVVFFDLQVPPAVDFVMLRRGPPG
jgi:hypothetical protein